RAASQFMNRLFPGKLRAAALLVANQRTREALPRGTTGRIVLLPENGVDLQTWFPGELPIAAAPVRFVFSGRLVDWKAVDLLLEAFAKLTTGATLDIIGDGPQRALLEAQVQGLGLAGRVRFHGWLPQPQAALILRNSDVLVLPSLYECGGAVVLEAMATGLPVIATAWGGPADYIDAGCGILVQPDSRDGFINGLAAAMQLLGADPALRERMGRAGRIKAANEYDWNAKVDKMLQIYSEAVAG
ncbi:MAG TPA: glycosyltransferase family 4 protein, partial [Steroidobacteraceae bacterium]|nr:glycosyltransferase family 4 protein [Steroidobacteraceae bacterium]